MNADEMRGPANFSELTVAVVGYGSIGKRHCENLKRLGVGRRIVVRRAGANNPAFTPPDDVCVVHSAGEALAQRPNLAIIATPTGLHVSSAIPYVEAGTAVLIEKPLAGGRCEVRPLLDAIKVGNAHCGMAYCFRYHPAFALARSALLAGRIGPVCYAKAWFESYLPEWHPWEDYRTSYAARADLGGGVLPTLDHDLDYFHWCFGQAEHCAGRSTRTGALEIDVDDLASLTVNYPGGVTAALAMSFCRRDRRRGFEIIGRQGTLRYDIEQGQLLLLQEASRQPEVLWDGRSYDLNQMYVDLLADALGWASAAPRGAAPVPLEAGIETLRVLRDMKAIP